MLTGELTKVPAVVECREEAQMEEEDAFHRMYERKGRCRTWTRAVTYAVSFRHLDVTIRKQGNSYVVYARRS